MVAATTHLCLVVIRVSPHKYYRDKYDGGRWKHVVSELLSYDEAGVCLWGQIPIVAGIECQVSIWRSNPIVILVYSNQSGRGGG